MAKKTLEIEVVLDLAPAEAQMRSFVGRHNAVNVAVANPAANVPNGAGVGTSSVNAGILEEQANASAMAVAQTRSAGYAPAAMTVAQRVDQNWDDAAFEQFLGRAPGSSGSRGSGGSRGNWGGRGFLGPPHPGAIRALAFQGFREIERAVSDLAGGESDASWADSPEQANVIRAQALVSASGGFAGSAAFAIPDLFGASWTPHAVLRQAQEGESWRKWQTNRRVTDYDLQGRSAARSAYASGGSSAEAIARINAKRDAEIAELDVKAGDLGHIINDRDAVVTETVSGGTGGRGITVTHGGDYTNSSEARTRARADFEQNRRRRSDDIGQAEEDVRRQVYEDSRFLSDTRNATRRNYSAAAGLRGLPQELDELHDTYEEKIQDAFRRGGAPAEAAVRQEYRSAKAAAVADYNRDSSIRITALNASAAVDNLNASNRPNDAKLYQIHADTDAAVLAAQNQHARPEEIQAIRNAGQARIQDAEASQGRAAYSQSIGLNTQTAQLTAAANNRPFDARIAGIRGSRDEALQNLPSDAPDSRRDQIRQNADLQEMLAARDFAHQRSDLNRSLQGSIDRAGYAIHGGPLAGIRSQISSILEQTDLDARHLEDQNEGPEAASRRRLGQLQLQGAQNEYFRSFQYRDANPNSVVGSGSLDGIRDAFRQAKDKIPGTGRGGEPGGSNGGWTQDQVTEALGYWRRIAEQGIGALAG